MAEKKLIDDNYLPCSEYKGHSRDEKGVARFEQHDEFYFTIVDASDEVILRSEGYKTEKGRDNGIESVLKNMSLENRYHAWQLPDGLWVLSLKAGNHQEIGRTCPQPSEEEAKAFLPSERLKNKDSDLSSSSSQHRLTPSTLGIEEDNYLGCAIYEANMKSISKYPDFLSFKYKNGQFYFAWISGNNLVMRSEGYRTESARDNGIEAVIQNRSDKTKYGFISAHGAHFVILKAANNQEIARTCPKKSEDEAWSTLRTTSISGLFGLTTSTSKISAADLKSAESVAASTKIISATKMKESSRDTKSSSGGMSWFWPILMIAILAGLLWWFWNQGFFDQYLNPPKPQTSEIKAPIKDTISKPLDSLAIATLAKWDSTLGPLVEIKLLNGASIQVPENGTEKNLVAFLNNGCKGDLQKTWFELDRVLFKEGSAEINEISNDQLTILSAIFQTYPNAKFKIGGYTDNIGNADLNTQLSGERAQTALNRIADRGMDSIRMSSEGYGPLYPICPGNITEECRAKNRRIAIRVEQCN
jgi:outer membrane protein OmpA-like peptidoglycan-associated protein/uncharacterized protein YegP (UPF0339 family)